MLHRYAGALYHARRALSDADCAWAGGLGRSMETDGRGLCDGGGVASTGASMRGSGCLGLCQICRVGRGAGIEGVIGVLARGLWTGSGRLMAKGAAPWA
ncbi:hypothetical protein EJ06DRAFT_45963 [Trichodelitschia bisporula]|uniref:Uncharacterized protein n=1 Tax=Trichodelitschia bisporula TaxID=703511 RepID=A0A6G1HVY9_9PEZI|nr:hypothetical protein EJ06DRAFT_45963 [Trichodelitschia bisporula]